MWKIRIAEIVFSGLSVWAVFQPRDYQVAFLPLLIPAIIGAVAAAGSGIAGAVQQGENSKMQAEQAAKDRAMQLALAKNQVAAREREQQKNLLQGGYQSLQGLYDERAQQAQAVAQRQGAAAGDAMNTIARTYLQGRR